MNLSAGELKILVCEPEDGGLIHSFGGTQKATSPVVVLDVFSGYGRTAAQQITHVWTDPIRDAT